MDHDFQRMAVSWSLLVMALCCPRVAIGPQKVISTSGMPGPVWHSSEQFNAQTFVASSCSKAPYVTADTACVSEPLVSLSLRVAEDMAHTALIAAWRWNDTVLLSVAGGPHLTAA